MDENSQLTAEQAQLLLAEYGAVTAGRDRLVLRSRAAGVSINRISKLTGIARTTIDRIIAAAAENTTAGH